MPYLKYRLVIKLDKNRNNYYKKNTLEKVFLTCFYTLSNLNYLSYHIPEPLQSSVCIYLISRTSPSKSACFAVSCKAIAK